MAAAHVFVDETKTRGLLLTAAAVLPGDLATARKAIRSFVLPGQRRLHFRVERDSRRKQIIDVLGDLGVTATLYDGSAHPRRQREVCLNALVADVATNGASHIVLEPDDSVVDLDRKILYRATRTHGCPEVHYEHLRAHEEPLLAIPDALAWCWQRDGWWRKRVQELITDVRKVCDPGQRETRPTYRPEGYRVHFIDLLADAKLA